MADVQVTYDSLQHCTALKQSRGAPYSTASVQTFRSGSNIPTRLELSGVVECCQS